MKIFTDDTKDYHAIASTDTLELQQNGFGKSEYWGGEWNMLYNIDKCHRVHFGENNGPVIVKLAQVIIEVQSKE